MKNNSMFMLTMFTILFVFLFVFSILFVMLVIPANTKVTSKYYEISVFWDNDNDIYDCYNSDLGYIQIKPENAKVRYSNNYEDDAVLNEIKTTRFNKTFIKYELIIVIKIDEV